MLSFVIRTTAVLLGLAALLVIVGSFDASLGWDIFSGPLEATLYAIFFSSLALAAVGIALSFILGIQEISLLLRASHEGTVLPRARSAKRYLVYSIIGAAGIAVLIAALARIDEGIQAEHRATFRSLAREQMAHFGPKLEGELRRSEGRPVASETLEQLLSTLNNLGFVEGATLYVPDPEDLDALWEYRRGWRTEGSRFERIFVAKGVERVIQGAFAGDLATVKTFNEGPWFSWLHVLTPADGRPAAILIHGRRSENLGEYPPLD